MGVPQNQAIISTSVRCWVSRRYTFTADRKMEMAPVKVTRATRAKGRMATIDQSGETPKMSMAATRTTT